MDSWLPWVIAIGGLLLVAVVLLVAGAAVRRRSAIRRRGGAGAGRPRAGEIWWADVPFEDGSGSKMRPCLVLRSGRDGAEVLKITSRDKGNRADHVRLPTRRWDPKAERDSYLELTDPIRVPAAAFMNRAGTCDPTMWRAVRQLHREPPSRR
jgi:hypothetical protein